MSHGEKPYRPPGAGAELKSGYGVPAREPGPVPKLKYWGAFAQVTKHPKWKENVLMTTMVQLVLVVGQTVFLGHLFEMIRGLHAGGDSESPEPYPAFKLDRFSELLRAGIAPAVVVVINLVLRYVLAALFAFILAFPMLVVFIVVGNALTRYAGVDPRSVKEIGSGIIAGLCVFTGFAAAGIFTRPMYLRAGLTRKIGEAYKFGFMARFIRLTWWRQFKAELFLTLVAPLLLALSMLLCVLPYYPALTWVWYTVSYMDFQIYEIYLARGGEPIPAAG